VSFITILIRGGYSKNVDLFFRYDYIPKFDVKTVFGDNQFDMNYITLSGMVKFDDLIKTDFFSWGAGISISGARYGLTKKVELEGPNGEKYTTIDMAYNQVYDDLVVFSNIIKPFGDIHIGILFNRDLDIGLDNVIGTSDDKENNFKTLFLNTNLFNVSLMLGYTYKNNEYNYFDLGFQVTDMLYDYTDIIKNRYLWPDFSIGYVYSKNDFEELANHVLYFNFMYSTYSYFYIKLKAGIPLYGQEGLEKEVGIKELSGEIGFHPKFAKIARNPQDYYGDDYYGSFFYYIIFGMSLYNDNRFINFGNDDATVIGWMVGFRVNFSLFIGGFDGIIKFYHNYSDKLSSMIECYGKNYLEFSIQIGF